ISTEPGLRRDAFLFGESQSRFVVSVPEAQRVHLESVLAGNSYMQLGKVTPGQILVDGEDFGPLGDWKEPYDTALERILEPDPS
ncbi:MAG TPA: hypothetical protein VMV20_05025, partial [Chitinophagaceae bacterium]|nr:hypothetical protein [Chitinophagaceae bacterium]